jgi:hypothetical protein
MSVAFIMWTKVGCGRRWGLVYILETAAWTWRALQAPATALNRDWWHDTRLRRRRGEVDASRPELSVGRLITHNLMSSSHSRV